MKTHHTPWKKAYYFLLFCWVGSAALHMLKIKAGFITNYLSDLTFPAWFYIYIRGLYTSRQKPKPISFAGTWFGESPERAFISIFLVGLLTEITSYYYPNGLFAGIFDWLDIVAYFIAMFFCYVQDKRQLSHLKKNNS